MNQQNLSSEKLSSLQGEIQSNLAKLEGRRILLIGDVGLDEYVLGDVSRISPEAPVPVVDVKSEETRVGLAANVAQNIASLGGQCFLIGVVGDDPAKDQLKSQLSAAGVDAGHLIVDGSRPTTRKTRVMSGHHHVVRVDYEHRRFLAPDVEKQILKIAGQHMEKVDGLILQDYAKGVLSENLTQALIQMAHEKGKEVMVDPHRTTPLSYYQGADLFKPNREEAFILSGLNIDDLREDSESLIEVGRVLQEKVSAKHLILTRGREGMSLFSEDTVTHLPTYARQVFDVTGAGDTVIAALGMAWFSGFPLEQVCTLANFAAGVVVGKVGCVPCTLDQLRAYLESHKLSN